MSTKARYDINFEPKKKRLTVKCNFPELEIGATHLERNWMGPRGALRFDKIRRLVELGNDAAIHQYISVELKVGSTKFVAPPAEVMPRPPEVDGMLSQLGKLGE